MNYLYYGNGDCTIEAGSRARGVEIRYTGKITIEKTCSDEFAIMQNNNAIIIFPISPSREGYLNNLFKYRGAFNISYIIVSDKEANAMEFRIKKVMDYAELLDTNAEDLQTFSENLKSSSENIRHFDGINSINEINNYDFMIKNLNSDEGFYLKDGTPYSGPYHIHTKDSSCMTGSMHSEKSQDLYFKQSEGKINKGKTIERLVPTKNPSHIPQSIDHYKKRRRPS